MLPRERPCQVSLPRRAGGAWCVARKRIHVVCAFLRVVCALLRANAVLLRPGIANSGRRDDAAGRLGLGDDRW